MPHAMTGALLLALAALPATGAPSAAPVAPAAPAAFVASAPMPAHTTAATLRHRPKIYDHLVDINSAGRQELMTLPGIGPAEAGRIVSHRPYLTKTELVTKEVLPVGPFLSLKNQVVAMQKFKPKGKG